MYINLKTQILGVGLSLVLYSCSTPALIQKEESASMPTGYAQNLTDTTNSAQLLWKDYFNDSYLSALIDTALSNNQELNIMLMEIAIAKNEVGAKKGEYLPKVGVGIGTGVDKVGRYTSQGANDANTDIAPGVEFPDPLGDLRLTANLSWELDVWKKLRNSRKSAYMKYLSSIEGKNFMVTNLIAEIADSYYELLALDNELEIVNQNITIQNDALNVMRMQKKSAKVTQLPVNRFEALLLNTKSLVPIIEQKIIEAENMINFLVGRFPQKVERQTTSFIDLKVNYINIGTPNQLLENRPDIRQAELMLASKKLDVKIAKANFYPSLGLSSRVGLQAFNLSYLARSPESIIYSLIGDLAVPIINRKGIKAMYQSANNKQIQAVYEYEKTILNAYIDVSNQSAKFKNLNKSVILKKQEVALLTASISISNTLFKSARADYMEVLLTQKEALESKFELVETKKEQMSTFVKVYKSLGGGWKIN